MSNLSQEKERAIPTIVVSPPPFVMIYEIQSDLEYELEEALKQLGNDDVLVKSFYEKYQLDEKNNSIWLRDRHLDPDYEGLKKWIEKLRQRAGL